MDDADGGFSWTRAERRPGETYTIAGVATIQIVAFDAARHLATVIVGPAPATEPAPTTLAPELPEREDDH
jgi:hypothetical protein